MDKYIETNTHKENKILFTWNKIFSHNGFHVSPPTLSLSLSTYYDSVVF